MNISINVNPENANKADICMALIHNMTDFERKDFLNRLYGVCDSNIKMLMGDVFGMHKIITTNNNDIQHITEAVRLILVAALSNEDKMIKDGILKQAYEEMTKTTNFDISLFE